MVWSSMAWRKGAGRCFSHVAERSSEMDQRCEWLEMWYSNAWQQQFPGSPTSLLVSMLWDLWCTAMHRNGCNMFQDWCATVTW